MDLKEMYPGQVNSPVTYLAQDIGKDDAMITVMDGAALPEGPNIATIGFGEDSETVYYESKTGNVLNGVVRGFQGKRKEWPAGAAPVARLFSAYDLDTAAHNIQALGEHSGEHQHRGDDGSSTISYNDLRDLPEIDVTGQLREVIGETVNSRMEVPLDQTIGQKSDLPSDGDDATLMALAKQMNEKIDAGSGKKADMPSYFNIQEAPLKMAWEKAATVKAGFALDNTCNFVTCEDKIYLFGNSVSPFNQVRSFDPKTRIWICDHTPCDLDLRNAIYVVAGKKIYVFFSQIAPNTQMKVYDTETDTWANRATATVSLTGTQSTSYFYYENKIYVVGREISPNRYIYIYDIETNRWSTSAATATTSILLAGTQVQLCNGKIYVFGVSYTTSVIYDIATNSWSNGPAVTTLRGIGSMNSAVVGDKIYIFGNYTNPRQMQIYDTTKNTVSGGATVNSAYSLTAVHAIANNEYIYVITNTNKKLLIYDTINNKWILGLDMPSGNYGSKKCICMDKLYINAGTNIEIFDVASKLWPATMPPAVSQAYASIIFKDQKIYAFGGSNIGIHGQIYDLETELWKSTGFSDFGFVNCTTLLHEDKIYVFGGNISPFTQVRIYDIETDTWTNGANANVRLDSSSYFLLDNKVYVAGHSLQAYDLELDEWTVVSSRSGMTTGGSIYHDDKVFVFGNGTGIHIYDMKNDVWQTGDDSVTLNGARIFHYGGTACALVGNTLHYYDLEADTWVKGPASPEAITAIQKEGINEFYAFGPLTMWKCTVTGWEVGVLKAGHTVYGVKELYDPEHKIFLKAGERFTAEDDMVLEATTAASSGWIQYLEG